MDCKKTLHPFQLPPYLCLIFCFNLFCLTLFWCYIYFATNFFFTFLPPFLLPSCLVLPYMLHLFFAPFRPAAFHGTVLPFFLPPFLLPAH